MTFFRFPHTPHLAWLSPGTPRDDKVLPPDEVASLLAAPLVIEEKVDGANLGLSVDDNATLRGQNRGEWLRPDHLPPQFKTLPSWLAPREHRLIDALWPDLMLFGEWCYATHSVAYAHLPDWFLAFDVYDRAAGRFWSTTRRNALLAELGLHPVPEIARARFDLAGLNTLLATPSRLTAEPIEGVYVREEDPEWLIRRAKLVRPSFTQAIDTHWSRGPLRTNEVDRRLGAAPSPANAVDR